MLYNENQELGGGGYDDDELAKKKKPKQPGVQPAGGGTAAQPVQQPQTFAQQQKAGLARPPMPTATLAPRIITDRAAPSSGMQSGVQAAPPGSTITTTAYPGQTNPWTGQKMPGGAPPAQPSGAPPAGTPNFDPMDYLRRQITGDIADTDQGRAYGYFGGQIDDEYSLREQQLREEMAGRGLADSTVYGGRMQDLNVGRRSAKADLGERLGSQATDQRTRTLQQMLGLGQQGFDNDMRTADFNRQLDQDYQNYILQMLGFGYGG